MSLTSTAVVTASHQSVSRPLTDLVLLINQELEAGTQAEESKMTHYRNVGELMLEAKAQLEHGKFMPWIKTHFHMSQPHASHYMNLAKHEKQNLGTPKFSSISDFVRKTSNPDYNKPHTVRPAAWDEPVKKTMDDPELIERIRRDTQSKLKESRLVRELGLKLIDIGYKVLSTKVHPDKGGNHDAMRRLNHVRDLLKKAL